MLFIFLYLFFLYLHWPYLLTFDYSNFLSILEPFKVYGFYKVFFNGDFFGSTFLPLSYLPKWILISTPEFYIPLFLIGILFYLKRIFLRVFNLKEVSSGNDLWNGVNDKVDLFIFLSLFQSPQTRQVFVMSHNILVVIATPISSSYSRFLPPPGNYLCNCYS